MKLPSSSRPANVGTIMKSGPIKITTTTPPTMAAFITGGRLRKTPFDGSPRLVRGDVENLKVTWPADFALAARLLETRR